MIAKEFQSLDSFIFIFNNCPTDVVEIRVEWVTTQKLFDPCERNSERMSDRLTEEWVSEKLTVKRVSDRMTA